LAGLLLLGLATSFLVVASDREIPWFLPLDQLRIDRNWIITWHSYLNHYTTGSDAVLVVGTPAVFHLKFYFATWHAGQKKVERCPCTMRSIVAWWQRRQGCP
jgi:hypothetical protein